ncbi:MAG TPA: AI-2E family transporter [Opitutaceae bacterium]|nr:AI-2E family transporter [Opitutaceae bacterium]
MPDLPPVKLTTNNARFTGFVTFASFVLAMAVMKIGEEVLIPIALTILLTFLLTPFVVRLTRWGMPKAVAILTTVTIAAAILAGVAFFIVNQVASLMTELPNYEVNIRLKIARIKTQPDPDSVTRFSDLLNKVRRDIENPTVEPPPVAPPKSEGQKQAKPVAVEVTHRATSRAEALQALLGSLVRPIGTAIVVAVFVITMLFQREDLRDRFIKVISSGKLNLATEALDDAAQRVTRYLLMQLTVNICYGIPIGLGLYLIGIPHALLWGVVATLLRFIPFLGPWIAAVFPVVLAAAVEPGWAKMFYVLGIFVLMEIVTPNFIEPWLYGKGTGISNLALLIAAVFWTWLWGTPGLFLSTPLTVCIMVLGKYVPGLRFISVLLGSEPVLEPSARFYQRMLSMDSDEMAEIAHDYIEARSLDEFYDAVFVPALLMSERDRHSGSLAEVRQRFIFDASRELIDSLERDTFPKSRGKGDEDENASASASAPASLTDDERTATPIVFGMPARDDADEVVALMLQHLLRVRGIETEVVPVTVHPEDSVQWIKQHDIQVAFISALPPAALLGTRQLCRRIREGCPNVKLLVGVWDREMNFEDIKARLRRPTPDAIVAHLSDAVRQIERLVHESAASKSDPQIAVANKAAEASAQDGSEAYCPPLNLRDREPGEYFDVVSRDLAQRFSVPLSLISISATDKGFWKNFSSHEADVTNVNAEEPQFIAPPHSTDELYVVEDITKDKNLSSYNPLTERGIRFYGTVPLRNKLGRVVGNITVVDTKPRDIGTEGKHLLDQRAAELMAAVESAIAEAR